MSNLDRVVKWLALDFDGRPWTAIAAWLFAAQVVLFLISRAVDAIWFPVTSTGFFAAMLLFAGYVFLDALQVGYSFWRAGFWASVVTIGWIFGAVPYALRRQHRRRGQSVTAS
jgi:hypothetical protein